MSRTKYTVTFPAGTPGDEVTWPNSVKVYADKDTPTPLGSGTLRESLTFSCWSDASSVTFTRPAGTNDHVTVTAGSPAGSGNAAPSDSGSSSPTWIGPFTVTKDTPQGTDAGIDVAVGTILLGAHQVTREPFDTAMFLTAEPRGDVYVDVASWSTEAEAGNVTPNHSPTPNSALLSFSTYDILPAMFLHSNFIWSFDGYDANTTGDADLYLLVVAPPV